MGDTDETRQRLLYVESQQAKLWTALREATSVLWGDDVRRDNGLRSTVNTLKQVTAELESDLDDLRERLRHYLDVERGETCLGLAAMEARQKEEVPVKVAQIQSSTASRTQLIILIGVLVTGILNFVGVLISIKQGGG